MKKILLLLLFIFLSTGCYDYHELKDLKIVSGVFIDYQNNDFLVTYEIISTQSDSTSYTVSAQGKTVAEAFLNNEQKLDKEAYFEHTKIVLISEEVAKKHLEEVATYIISNSFFRNEVYMAITKDDLLKNLNKMHPVVATYLVSCLKNGYKKPFTETLADILTPGSDTMMPNFTLKNEEVILSGIGIFKDYELKDILNTEDSSLFNLLNNFHTNNITLKSLCSTNKYTVLNIYEAKINLKPTKSNLIVSGSINSQIIENNCHLDLKDTDTYQNLQEYFLIVLENKMTNIFNILKRYQSNSLKIGTIYYNKYRDPNYLLWTSNPIIYDLNLKINKKGLTYEFN